MVQIQVSSDIPDSILPQVHAHKKAGSSTKLECASFLFYPMIYLLSYRPGIKFHLMYFTFLSFIVYKIMVWNMRVSDVTYNSHLSWTSAGTTTSWLPITSRWRSRDCSQLFYTTLDILYAFHPALPPSWECLPPEVSSLWDIAYNQKTTLQIGLGPEFACPRAYTTADTSVTGFDFTNDQTKIYCCPSYVSLKTLKMDRNNFLIEW